MIVHVGVVVQMSRGGRSAALRAQGFVDEDEPTGDESDASERGDRAEDSLAGQGKRI